MLLKCYKNNYIKKNQVEKLLTKCGKLVDNFYKIYKIYKKITCKKVIQHFFINCNKILKKSIKNLQKPYFLREKLKIIQKALTF